MLTHFFAYSPLLLRMKYETRFISAKSVPRARSSSSANTAVHYAALLGFFRPKQVLTGNYYPLIYEPPFVSFYQFLPSALVWISFFKSYFKTFFRCNLQVDSKPLETLIPSSFHLRESISPVTS